MQHIKLTTDDEIRLYLILCNEAHQYARADVGDKLIAPLTNFDEYK